MDSQTLLLLHCVQDDRAQQIYKEIKEKKTLMHLQMYASFLFFFLLLSLNHKTKVTRSQQTPKHTHKLYRQLESITFPRQTVE